MEKTLIQDLLTEDRYWTFWTSDWSKRINILWGGKTKFEDVKKTMMEKLGADCIYERQVELREPEISFE